MIENPKLLCEGGRVFPIPTHPRHSVTRICDGMIVENCRKLAVVWSSNGVERRFDFPFLSYYNFALPSIDLTVMIVVYPETESNKKRGAIILDENGNEICRPHFPKIITPPPGARLRADTRYSFMQANFSDIEDHIEFWVDSPDWIVDFFVRCPFNYKTLEWSNEYQKIGRL